MGLPALWDKLRGEDFAIGTEQLLSVQDFLVGLAAVGRELTVAELRGAIGSIVCTNPAEQRHFPEIFDLWYLALARGSLPTTPQFFPKPPTPPTWPDTHRRERARAWLTAGIVCITAVGAGWHFFKPSPPIDQITVSAPPEAHQPTPSPPSTKAAKLSQFAPRVPPEPVIPPLMYDPWWVPWAHRAWLVVVLPWGIWLGARLLLRQTVLTRRQQQAGEPIRLDTLRLAGEGGMLFSTTDLADTWRFLRKFRTLPSSRLNDRATIDRTLEAGGFFCPVYRERQVPPAYLLLVDRRHGEDHAAAIATELETALRREQIAVATFDYHDDPRYCRSPRDHAALRGPAALAGIYSDRTLLLVGDGDAIFETTTGRAQPWIQDFLTFKQKHILTNDPAWRLLPYADHLARAGFKIQALTPEGLKSMPGNDNLLEDNPHDLPLPRRFAVSPEYWLDVASLKRKIREAIVRDLSEYMGRQGFLLLCATAAYPGIYWRLTRALDAQLELSARDRTWRLRKLARLPWFRYGTMPDAIRLALLRSLDRQSRRRITDAYHALIEHRTSDPLTLPVAVPNWEKSRADVREMTEVSPRHEPLGDKVFADVIRGRKPHLLEFGLSTLLTGAPVRQEWRSLVGSVLLVVLLIPAAIWANVWGWHKWLKPLAESQRLEGMQTQHQNVQVRITAPVSHRALSTELQRALKEWGFRVDIIPSGDQGATSFLQENLEVQRLKKGGGSDELTLDRSRVSYRPEFKDAAMLVATRAQYLAYGVEPELREDVSLSSSNVDISIQLAGELRGFRDVFKGSAQFREPEMAVIQPRTFKMGDIEGKGEKDERPVHEVRIQRPFMMSRYETTFEEYDLFSQATGRALPDDSKWGRARRPVINISWEDAKAYADWLSQQTGKRYRLPTEAEWEYAARRGGVTAIWAGTSDERQLQEFAVYSQNSQGRTAPIGGKNANGFGLYDMSGNVWEFVEDCWHETYKDAPSDGSAWLEADGGSCGRRVIRGGAWNANPKFLRVSDRGWNVASDRHFFLGFRLAQDIESSSNPPAPKSSPRVRETVSEQPVAGEVPVRGNARPGGLAGGINFLQGQILENHGDRKRPAVGAQVWIVNVGNPYLTQSDGAYRLLVPDSYRLGQTIVLYVKHRGWAIAAPVGGKVVLSMDLTADILLSPEASSEFLSPAQLDNLLESLPEKLMSQVKPGSKEGGVDPALVVREYATEHGLPEGEVIAKVAALVKQYEQSSDLGKQCLAARYRNDLKQVATRCERNTTSRVDLLKKKRQEVEDLINGANHSSDVR